MPYPDVLVHLGYPIRSKQETGSWVEGEWVAEDNPDAADAVPFECCIFLPQGQETADNSRSRKIREPLLIYGPEDTAGRPVALIPEDVVDVVAPELNYVEGRDADARVRWRIAGAAQPFGPPGEDVVGSQVTVRRIED